MDPVNDETNNDEANNETNDETNNEVDEVEAITTALESVERKLREKVQELNETLSTIKCETLTFIDRQQRLSNSRASIRRQITAIIKKIHHDIFPDEKNTNRNMAMLLLIGFSRTALICVLMMMEHITENIGT